MARRVLLFLAALCVSCSSGDGPTSVDAATDRSSPGSPCVINGPCDPGVDSSCSLPCTSCGCDPSSKKWICADVGCGG